MSSTRKVVRAGLVLSSKDKKVATLLRPPAEQQDGADASSSSYEAPVLAEIKSIYRLPSGADGNCREGSTCPRCQSEALPCTWSTAARTTIMFLYPRHFGGSSEPCLYLLPPRRLVD